MTGGVGVLIVVFVLAACWGTFLDRCIQRLAWGKSLAWPIRSHCPYCVIPWTGAQSLPLGGLFVGAGKCLQCGRPRQRRRLLVELLTAGLITGLYWLYLYDFTTALRLPFFFSYHPPHRIALFIYHGVLVSLLIVASFIDLDWMIIPDAITMPGLAFGLIVGSLYIELHPAPLIVPAPQTLFRDLLSVGTLQQWFGDLPPWLARLQGTIYPYWDDPLWGYAMGLTTGLVGAMAGGLVVWLVRAVCSWIFGQEAMGFGDVTLMMMVGSFLGWQLSIVAFFLAPISAIFVGAGVWLFLGRTHIPYGPHLALGSLVCLFGFSRAWEFCQPLFHFSLDRKDLVLMGLGGLVMLAVSAVLVRLARRLVTRG